MTRNIQAAIVLAVFVGIAILAGIGLSYWLLQL